MSGLLDNKSRVIDAVLTTTGRAQLAKGGLNIRNVSFTDTGTYYRADVVSGSADASTRIYLEAPMHLPQDDVTFKADDSGLVQPFDNASGIKINNGKILVHSFAAPTTFVVTGALDSGSTLSSVAFASATDDLLLESISNFSRLQLLSTHDQLFDDDGFSAGPSQVGFMITDTNPLPLDALSANVDHVVSLFNDPKLSRLPNFKFLPPVNRIHDDAVDKTNTGATKAYHLGTYRPWGDLNELTFTGLSVELDRLASVGFSRSITFDPTTRENRLVGQAFENTHGTLRKLDVIDVGTHKTGEQDSPLARVFFVGRVLIDGLNTQTFVPLFIMVFR